MWILQCAVPDLSGSEEGDATKSAIALGKVEHLLKNSLRYVADYREGAEKREQIAYIVFSGRLPGQETEALEHYREFFKSVCKKFLGGNRLRLILSVSGIDKGFADFYKSLYPKDEAAQVTLPKGYYLRNMNDVTFVGMDLTPEDPDTAPSVDLDTVHEAIELSLGESADQYSRYSPTLIVTPSVPRVPGKTSRDERLAVIQKVGHLFKLADAAMFNDADTRVTFPEPTEQGDVICGLGVGDLEDDSAYLIRVPRQRIEPRRVRTMHVAVHSWITQQFISSQVEIPIHREKQPNMVVTSSPEFEGALSTWTQHRGASLLEGWRETEQLLIEVCSSSSPISARIAELDSSWPHFLRLWPQTAHELISPDLPSFVREMGIGVMVEDATKLVGKDFRVPADLLEEKMNSLYKCPGLTREEIHERCHALKIEKCVYVLANWGKVQREAFNEQESTAAEVVLDNFKTLNSLVRDKFASLHVLLIYGAADKIFLDRQNIAIKGSRPRWIRTDMLSGAEAALKKQVRLSGPAQKQLGDWYRQHVPFPKEFSPTRDLIDPLLAYHFFEAAFQRFGEVVAANAKSVELSDLVEHMEEWLKKDALGHVTEIIAQDASLAGSIVNVLSVARLHKRFVVEGGYGKSDVQEWTDGVLEQLKAQIEKTPRLRVWQASPLHVEKRKIEGHIEREYGLGADEAPRAVEEILDVLAESQLLRKDGQEYIFERPLTILHQEGD